MSWFAYLSINSWFLTNGFVGKQSQGLKQTNKQTKTKIKTNQKNNNNKKTTIVQETFGFLPMIAEMLQNYVHVNEVFRVCLWMQLPSDFWGHEKWSSMYKTCAMKTLIIGIHFQKVSLLHVLKGWWWWLFPRMRGFGENVRPFIPCLCFFLKWRLACAHGFHSLP